MTPDQIPGDAPPTLEQLRAECRSAWHHDVRDDVTQWFLANGPLRGELVPAPLDGKAWQGTWFDDFGQQILVTYEMNDEGMAEYSGSKTMTDIATDVANEQFDKERGDAEVDLDTMPAAEARDFLAEDNARRIAKLMENTGGRVDLSDFFVPFECVIYLRHLVHALGPERELDATLDYENAVSLKLDEIEDKMVQQQAALETAQRQAMLQGQGPPRPIHNGRVTTPARRIRRGN
ncbi:MAG: hypothetical protein WBS24_03435 [Terriglobales bacterium]